MKPLIFLLLFPISLFSQTDWSKVESAIGRKGTVKDNMLKVTFPRSDLKVTVGEVEVSPGLALTSWMGFMPHGSGAMVMGDIVLLDKEVQPVEAKLIEEGISITAIHNHLVNESPSVKYMHIEASGNADELAEKLKNVFALTGTPFPPPQQPLALQINWSEVENIMGRKGDNKGSLLQFGIPRAEKIMENGMEVPPYMGMAIAINMQKSGDKVATTGDFVLIASEIKPVMRALHEHGITATALHNHMLNESPRMFMMHFWGYDTPENIAQGLASALKKCIRNESRTHCFFVYYRYENTPLHYFYLLPFFFLSAALYMLKADRRCLPMIPARRAMGSGRIILLSNSKAVKMTMQRVSLLSILIMASEIGCSSKPN